MSKIPYTMTREDARRHLEEIAPGLAIEKVLDDPHSALSDARNDAAPHRLVAVLESYMRGVGLGERARLGAELKAFVATAPIGEVKLLVRLSERIERGREEYARAVQANGDQGLKRGALLDLYIAAEIAEEAS